MTSRTRGSLAALALCALLWAGTAGCGAGGARGSGTQEKSPAPVGKVIDHTDEEGRPYREVARQEAPEVGVEVRPDADGSWDVRLTVRRFSFSPAGTAARAAAGRGLARLLVDGRPVGRLRAPDYRLSARLVPRGTHHVTARLYADDDTVWAVAGSAVQSTADITASGPTPRPGASSGAPPRAMGAESAAHRAVGSAGAWGAGRRNSAPVSVPAVTAVRAVPAAAPEDPAETRTRASGPARGPASAVACARAPAADVTPGQAPAAGPAAARTAGCAATYCKGRGSPRGPGDAS